MDGKEETQQEEIDLMYVCMYPGVRVGKQEVSALKGLGNGMEYPQHRQMGREVGQKHRMNEGELAPSCPGTAKHNKLPT